MTTEVTRKVISHSEVESLAQCEVKHKYAHVDKITSSGHSGGLNRGNAGHKFFETFFQSLLDGKNTPDAKTVAVSAAASMPNGIEIMPLCIEWVDKVWPGLGWKIVAVELELRVTISPTMVYACKVDLIVEIDGELVLVDHKFLYDFYSQQLIDIFPQMPKYIAALRNNGLDVRYAIYNMVRTRKVNEFSDRYQRLITKPNSFRIKAAMLEQIEGMRRIEQGIEFPLHTANKMNCGNCQFSDLCQAELSGESTKLMREHFFVPNTYGYEDV